MRVHTSGTELYVQNSSMRPNRSEGKENHHVYYIIHVLCRRVECKKYYVGQNASCCQLRTEKFRVKVR